MSPPVTGNDLARLLQVVYARGYTWGMCDTLGVPYRLDRPQQVIYVDGRLPLVEFYTALADALDELAVDGLAVLHPRPVGLRRIS
jgi:hypothetical protein